MWRGINRYQMQRNRLLNFHLSTIDNMRTGPSVTSRKGSKTCGYFFESNILSCLTNSDAPIRDFTDIPITDY